MSEASTWAWVVPAASGGLAGAVVTALFNHWKMRLELALAEVREFIPKSAELGAVLGLLDAKRQLTPQEHNRAIAMGDWMDTVAYLYLKRHLDEDLLFELGLVKQIKRFRRMAGDAVSFTPALASALQSWRHMAALDR